LRTYLARLTEDVRRRLPEEDPGSHVVNRLIGIHIATNKRDITVCIQTAGPTLLRLRYGMPVPAGASPIFHGAGELLAPTHTQFSEHTVARGQSHMAVCGVVGQPTWTSEVERVIAFREDNRNPVAVDETPMGRQLRLKRFRGANKVLLYWSEMRPAIMEALMAAGVDVYSQNVFQRFSTSEPAPHSNRAAGSGSEPKGRTSTASASPRRRSSSARRSAGRRAAAATRRRSSNRLSSNPT
jgi:hypothetical protein